MNSYAPVVGSMPAEATVNPFQTRWTVMASDVPVEKVTVPVAPPVTAGSGKKLLFGLSADAVTTTPDVEVK